VRDVRVGVWVFDSKPTDNIVRSVTQLRHTKGGHIVRSPATTAVAGCLFCRI
jgi:hypothetical protein